MNRSMPVVPSGTSVDISLFYRSQYNTVCSVCEGKTAWACMKGKGHDTSHVGTESSET